MSSGGREVSWATAAAAPGRGPPTLSTVGARQAWGSSHPRLATAHRCHTDTCPTPQNLRRRVEGPRQAGQGPWLKIAASSPLFCLQGSPASSRAALMSVFKHHAENLSLPRAQQRPTCTHIAHAHPPASPRSPWTSFQSSAPAPNPTSTSGSAPRGCHDLFLHTGQLQTTETPSLTVWRQESEIKVSAGPAPSETCGGSVLASLPRQPLLVGAAGAPWCSWADSCVTPISASLTPGFCLFLFL